MFLKPEGQRLHLLVRAPLSAMLDVDYPKRGQGLLDLARADAWLPRRGQPCAIADNLQVREGDTVLPYPQVVDVRASLASDPSFRSYEEALAHVTGPRLPNTTDFIWNQGLLDVSFEYPIQVGSIRVLDSAEVCSIGIRTVTVSSLPSTRWAVRAFEFPGDPGLVRLDPRWYQASLWFVREGSGTSWTEPITCCSCFASSSHSAASRARARGHVLHRGALPSRSSHRLTTWRRTRCGFRRSSKRSSPCPSSTWRSRTSSAAI